MPSGPPSVGRQRSLLLVAAAVGAVLFLVVWVLLSSSLPQETRGRVSAAGLVVAGALAVASGTVRAAWSTGSRRRAWGLLALAGLVAVSGNVLAAVLPKEASVGPLPVTDLVIASALLLAIASLTLFTQDTRRGFDLAVMALDGLILGSAVLMIAAGLVYSPLLTASDERVAVLAGLVIPLLDVVLATVALVLLRRTRGPDRIALGLVAAGFVVYTMTDLGYAVRSSTDDFALGTLLDLGWIGGYLLLGLAAWWPTRVRDATTEEATAGAEDWDTAVVFGVLLVAVLVAVIGEGGRYVVSIESTLWLVLVGGAGLRQGLIARENRHLRRNLESDVRERTADLRRMGRETEVLLSSVADGIYGVDNDGRVTFVNPSGAAMLGYAVEELTGRDAHEMFHAPAEDGTPFPAEACYITEAVRLGLVSNGEADSYVRADGETFPVEITASPLVDSETEEVRGGVVVFRDVTQRHEVERVKNEFLSVVSHELRTPLTSIRGSLGLLAGGVLGDLPESAGSMVDRALQSSERLTRMINDILDLERIESGSLTLEVLPHDVDDLLAVADREMAGLAASHDVRIVRSPGCAARVLADHDRIVQSLTNLVGNAVKFSPPGAVVELGAELRGDTVVMIVRDHGRGIPADRMESIFDRFEQVDSSDMRQQGGSGLGLAICRGIVERHGGRVWLESEPGVGTTASLALRAAPAGLRKPRPSTIVAGRPA